MAAESLSEHCSLMTRPGGAPKPSVRPSDCPKDAAYIKTTDAGRSFFLRGDVAPFPVVLDGGAGDDKVTVIGAKRGKVLVSGGDGNDSIALVDRWSWIASRFTPSELLMLATLFTVCATIALLGWRALGAPADNRKKPPA